MDVLQLVRRFRTHVRRGALAEACTSPKPRPTSSAPPGSAGRDHEPGLRQGDPNFSDCRPARLHGFAIDERDQVGETGPAPGTEVSFAKISSHWADDGLSSGDRPGHARGLSIASRR
jgi:hypothetical protein